MSDRFAGSPPTPVGLRGVAAEDFRHSQQAVAGTLEALPAVVKAVRLYRDRRLPVVHVVRLYTPGGEDADLCRRDDLRDGPSALAPGSEGSQPLDGLLPPDFTLDHQTLLQGQLQRVSPSETVMYKPRWGAFHRTPLEDHLAGLGVNTVVLAGTYFPNCVRATFYEASSRDLRCALIPEAVAGVTRHGLAELARIGLHMALVSDLPRLLPRQG